MYHGTTFTLVSNQVTSLSNHDPAMGFNMLFQIIRSTINRNWTIIVLFKCVIGGGGVGVMGVGVVDISDVNV